MPAPSTTPELADDLAELLRGALRSDAWVVTTSGTWAQARQRGVELPAQGWKIHVSATPSNAAEVVSRCLEVLSGARCVFKVPAARRRFVLRARISYAGRGA